jgi:hypothetical protein
MTTLAQRLPVGSTVRVQDITLRPPPKPVRGVVQEIRTNAFGYQFLRIVTKDSTLDTLPENVTLIRRAPELALPLPLPSHLPEA